MHRWAKINRQLEHHQGAQLIEEIFNIYIMRFFKPLSVIDDQVLT